MTESVYLNELVDIYLGLTHTPEYVLDGVPFLSVKNISSGTIDFSQCNYITEEEYNSLPNGAKPQCGDMLFCRVGTIGKPVIIEEDTPRFGLFVSLGFFRVKDNNLCKLKYLYYWMYSESFYSQVRKNVKGTSQVNLNTGWLKKFRLPLYSLATQAEIVQKLEEVDRLITLRQEQLAKLDELVKSRFIELFGDPITNSNNLPTERMEQRFNLKAGITTAADDIHDFAEGVYEIPCYGGNGIRGYVKEKTYTGDYPIIGRQGALCGNVQYATGDFHATEHAVLVSLLKNDNSVWVYHLLRLMDLYRYHTGAAQPGLAVKTLNTVEVIVADKSKQNQFAVFVEQTDKSKLAVQQSLEKLETLKKALMQKYFG